MTINQTLNYWASLGGNALKSAVAKDLESNVSLQTYVKAVLDPSIVYNIKGKLKFGLGSETFEFGGYDLLDSLARRELTGNAAKAALDDFAALRNQDAVDLMNCALNKDLRCGVGTTLINSLGLDFTIPVFECALAHPATEKRFKAGREWLVATKYDGIRTLVKVDDNQASFWTRSGKPIPRLQCLEPAVLEIFGGCRVVLDAEGVSKSFLESVSSMRGKARPEDVENDVKLMVFDMLRLDDFERCNRSESFGSSLMERLASLSRMFCVADSGKVQYVSHQMVSDWGTLQDLFQKALDDGQEGVIARRADSAYTKRRTADWLKLKLEETVDARIEGIYEGQGKYEGMMGYVTVDVDGVLCQVGGGWTDEERAAAWNDHSLVLDRIIEIGFNGKMPSGALRHPRKYRFRDIDGEKA